ncbi:hypothetical protein AAHA92_15284 [Salvia divinorum]|uniref:Uncharacterized protein n=1 Tax=Salvia divinorum TaxID=28513 RepID=A0ABD1HE86_SALDI
MGEICGSSGEEAQRNKRKTPGVEISLSRIEEHLLEELTPQRHAFGSPGELQKNQSKIGGFEYNQYKERDTSASPENTQLRWPTTGALLKVSKKYFLRCEV